MVPTHKPSPTPTQSPSAPPSPASATRTPPPPTCTNGGLDGGESDADCGGITLCARCAVGRGCADSADCAPGGSALGLGVVCAAATSLCTDTALVAGLSPGGDGALFAFAFTFGGGVTPDLFTPAVVETYRALFAAGFNQQPFPEPVAPRQVLIT